MHTHLSGGVIVGLEEPGDELWEDGVQQGSMLLGKVSECQQRSLPQLRLAALRNRLQSPDNLKI